MEDTTKTALISKQSNYQHDELVYGNPTILCTKNVREREYIEVDVLHTYFILLHFQSAKVNLLKRSLSPPSSQIQHLQKQSTGPTDLHYSLI